MPLVDIDLIIGGPQGGGIDSAAQIVIRAFSIAGYEAFGIREYYSNIKGRHSYFHVRVKETPVRSLRYPVDLLVCLDAESPFVHMGDVSDKTIVLYDEDLMNTKIEQVLTMESETKKHVLDKLKEGGFGTTIAGTIDFMKKRGAIPYPVSFRNLVVGALGPNKPPARYANTLGASLAMALMGLPAEFTSRGIESVFGKKKEVLEDNEKIVKSGYEFVKSHNNLNIKELPVREAKERYILTGNEAIGIGKVIGGLKLQTYYPITPAADESFFLEGHDYFEPVMGEEIDKENEVLKNTGIVVVQAEDEIAAIAMAISGAMTGTRTATPLLHEIDCSCNSCSKSTFLQLAQNVLLCLGFHGENLFYLCVPEVFVVEDYCLIRYVFHVNKWAFRVQANQKVHGISQATNRSFLYANVKITVPPLDVGIIFSSPKCLISSDRKSSDDYLSGTVNSAPLGASNN